MPAEHATVESKRYHKGSHLNLLHDNTCVRTHSKIKVLSPALYGETAGAIAAPNIKKGRKMEKSKRVFRPYGGRNGSELFDFMNNE